MSLRDRVLNEAATEPPNSGKLLNHEEHGSYFCGKCGNRLFDSDTKYHSGSGWPSFNDAIKGSVDIQADTSLGIVREEVKCANCGAHLGHRFPDGPKPTQQRYCINSVALDFKDQQGNKIEG